MNGSVVILGENSIKFLMENSYLSIQFTELAAWDICKSLTPIDSNGYDQEAIDDLIIKRSNELKELSHLELREVIIDHILDTYSNIYTDALQLKIDSGQNTNRIERKAMEVENKIKNITRGKGAYHKFVNSAILLLKRI